MSRNLSSISLAHVIAADDALLSPTSSDIPSWDHPFFTPSSADSFSYALYDLPPSPPTSVASSSGPPTPADASMLKMHNVPDTVPDCTAQQQQQLCIPTHQLFDFPPSPCPTSPTPPLHCLSVPPSPSPSASSLPSVSSASAAKRPAPTTPVSTPAKKARSAGERITSKDFVPPDVTGLSKREARLVKNRAAAFLSRQRKREEFENMEVRVAQLEQDNARLVALTQKGNVAKAHPHSDDTASTPALLAKIEQLNAKLAAAEERECALSAELAAKKAEEEESHPPRTAHPPKSGAASLGLMVLLCALPSLFSIPPSHKTAHHGSSFAPESLLLGSPSSLDMNAFFPHDQDWLRSMSGGDMAMDHDGLADRSPALPSSHRLRFVDAPTEALDALEVAFDASPAEDGHVRIRVHPVPADSTAATSASASASRPASPSCAETDPALVMWGGSDAASAFGDAFGALSSSSSSASLSRSTSTSTSSSAASSPPPADFLGIGPSEEDDEYGLGAAFGTPRGMFDDGVVGRPAERRGAGGLPFGLSSETSARRVRIALRGAPGAGTEGGEWEVRVC